MSFSPAIAKRAKKPRLPSWAFGLLAALPASFPWPAQSATPVVHNVVQEFSSASNPNGPWSYLFARSLASKGEINGEYALLEIPNPGKNDIGWGPRITEDQSFSLFQLTDDKGGRYWIPMELTSLALHASTLPTDADHWQAVVLAWTAPSDGVVDINYTVKNIAAGAISADDPIGIALDKFSAGSLDSIYTLTPLAAGETTTLKNIAPAPLSTDTSADISADEAIGIELGKFGAGSVESIYPLTPLAAGETTTLQYPGIAVKQGDQIQFYRDAYVNQRGLILFEDTSTLTFSPASS